MDVSELDLEGYISQSQRVRIITETWVKKKIFCPSCGGDLAQAKNNSHACDFICKSCMEEFELKSKGQRIGHKIVNGAYATLVSRVAEQNNPNLYVLQYDRYDYAVKNFIVVPRYFFTPQIIERRNPLAKTARRAGWVGCNIIVGNIPDIGKIHYIKDGVSQSKKKILTKWNETEFLRSKLSQSDKGWLLDTLMCIESMKAIEFNLTDLYAYEGWLKSRHPQNRHIKDKLRQQLQYLRDKGIVEFISRGQYRFIPPLKD